MISREAVVAGVDGGVTGSSNFKTESPVNWRQDLNSMWLKNSTPSRRVKETSADWGSRKSPAPMATWARVSSRVTELMANFGWISTTTRIRRGSRLAGSIYNWPWYPE